MIHGGDETSISLANLYFKFISRNVRCFIAYRLRSIINNRVKLDII